MIAVLLAVLAAASNATASVLQRKAVRQAPTTAFGLRLMGDLFRRPVWLAGIGALISGFLLQAAALGKGELALVQPVLVVELPFTLVVGAVVFRHATDLRAWLGIALLTVGLAAALYAASPTGGRINAPATLWILSGVVTVVGVGTLVFTAWRLAGAARAALLGAAAGVGFGFTAAVMKGATSLLSEGPAALFGSWQVYLMVAAGMVSVYLFQNALHAGTLVAVQPTITGCDPLASVAYGILLYGEHLRGGPWLVVELSGLLLIVAGSIEIARSLLASEEQMDSARGEAAHGAPDG